MKLTVHTFVTLDGVMQGPGGADEDRSGGFDQGGWLMPFGDADFGAAVEGWIAEADAFLLGRTTYELFFAFWSTVTDPDNAVATALNRLPKHVVSTTLRDPAWGDTSVISGDVVDAVAQLKARDGRELQVHGSAGLVRTLHDHGLVDEYRLVVAPVVLGAGTRLFPDGSVPSSFELASSSMTSTGCSILTLRPTGPVRTGDAAVEDGREVVR